MKNDGPNVDIETYSFPTTTPYSLVETINHERACQCGSQRKKKSITWLWGPPEAAFAHAREYPPEKNPLEKIPVVGEGLKKEDLPAAQELEGSTQ